MLPRFIEIQVVSRHKKVTVAFELKQLFLTNKTSKQISLEWQGYKNTLRKGNDIGFNPF